MDSGEGQFKHPSFEDVTFFFLVESDFFLSHHEPWDLQPIEG